MEGTGKENVINLLKEKEMLSNIRSKFNYHFIDGKLYTSVVMLGISFYVVFFNTFLFKEFTQNGLFTNLFAVAFFVLFIFVLFFSICMLFESDFKIVFNSNRYINSKLSSEEITLLNKVIDEDKKNKLDTYKSKINVQIKKIENKFREKENLELLYNELKSDPDLFSCYKSFFQEKLKEYNERQKRKAENNESLNKDLKEAGMDLLEDDSQSLSLKISEA